MQDKQHFFNTQKHITNVSSAETALITIERSQKLDLLIHLISNLKKSLVICGSSGIGKTTLLNELKTRKKEDWFITDIQASANLSIETFQHQLLRFLIVHYSGYESLDDLSSTLSALEAHHQKVVVIIDNASALTPGVITALIQFAMVNECLRIVFSLTHDELEIKKNSDRIIDECHYIDLPPLTQRQSGIFLQNLSTNPAVAISLTDINQSSIEKLYQETHGIPGKIISELPTLKNMNRIGSTQWMGAIIVGAVILTAGVGYLLVDKKDSKQDVMIVKESKGLIQTGVNKDNVFEKTSPPNYQKKSTTPIKHEKLEINKQWDNKKKERNPEQKNEKPPLIINTEANKKLQKENIIEVLELPKQDKIFAEPPLALTTPEVDKQEPKKAELKVSLLNKKDIVEKKGVSDSKKPTKKIALITASLNNKDKNTSSNKDDTAWVLKQPKANYTIQLMVLSSRQSAIQFLEKNRKLKNKLKFFKLNKQGKSKYVLIYGSFKDTLSVSKGIQFLPKKIKKPWVRKFSQIQKKLKK